LPFSVVHVAVEGDETAHASIEASVPVAFVDVTGGVDHRSSAFEIVVLPLAQVDVTFGVSVGFAEGTGGACFARVVVQEGSERVPGIERFFCGLVVHLCWHEAREGLIFAHETDDIYSV